ncbi:hypothetical protein C5167_021288 [Papaver somniferum]|uniref:Uncharacterized protein n=1 Tax=Papaver somniferum TaxID=3469 RepID=A0A4Y7IYP2_PAPSO|nr:uncharacterized protein LOC113354538 [Papaver somniferum]RZC52862.1 hypothetical protein C5167_021288 [Papaver somniferum]
MKMAAITKKRSSSYCVFAIVVSIFVYAEMVSAWKNMCVPGDIYMDLTVNITDPKCNNCTTWCKSECSKFELSMVKDTDKCLVKSPTLRCKCCCETPSSPEKPPLPPSASEFNVTEPEPYNYEICEGNQTSEKFKHPDGKRCIHKPLCEEYCNEKGLSKARSECVAAAYNTYRLNWYEQCCCEKLVPPPPPAPPTNVCEECSYLKRIVCVLPFSSPCNCCCKSLDLLSCKGIPPTQ